jgi:hypothetical protein
MKKKLPVILTALTAFAGISYAFADGLLNDAAYTREHGGVGNMLFRYSKEVKPETTADNLRDADANRYETATTDTSRTEPVVTDNNDEIDLGASSAGRAH